MTTVQKNYLLIKLDMFIYQQYNFLTSDGAQPIAHDVANLFYFLLLQFSFKSPLHDYRLLKSGKIKNNRRRYNSYLCLIITKFNILFSFQIFFYLYLYLYQRQFQLLNIKGLESAGRHEACEVLTHLLGSHTHKFIMLPNLISNFHKIIQHLLQPIKLLTS